MAARRIPVAQRTFNLSKIWGIIHPQGFIVDPTFIEDGTFFIVGAKQ
jgi:hypothetical protein